MNVCSDIPVAELAGSTDLAGAVDGAAWFRAARQRLDTVEPGLHAIDFTEVRLATVSWLREAVIGLQKYAATMRPDTVLIVANLADLVREELAVALEATGRVTVAATVSPNLQIHSPVLMGRLDPALSETLGVVQGQREFDASFVSRALPHVGLSAANNRLAALEDRGILKSQRRGRARLYDPVLEDLQWVPI